MFPLFLRHFWEGAHRHFHHLRHRFLGKKINGEMAKMAKNNGENGEKIDVKNGEKIMAKMAKKFRHFHHHGEVHCERWFTAKKFATSELKFTTRELKFAIAADFSSLEVNRNFEHKFAENWNEYC